MGRNGRPGLRGLRGLGWCGPGRGLRFLRRVLTDRTESGHDSFPVLDPLLEVPAAQVLRGRAFLVLLGLPTTAAHPAHSGHAVRTRCTGTAGIASGRGRRRFRDRLTEPGHRYRDGAAISRSSSA